MLFMTDILENQNIEIQEVDNTKLLDSIQATRKERDELAKKLKQYQNIDLAKYESLLELEKTCEEKKLEKASNPKINIYDFAA